MFSIISQNWLATAGQLLSSVKVHSDKQEQNGLSLLGFFDRRHYQPKRRVTPEQKANANLHPNKFFPEWKYTI